MLLKSIADDFGPMPLSRAIRYTASCFELSKVLDRKLPELARLADSGMVVDTEFGPFVFPSDEVENGVVSASFTWFRRSSFTQRKVTDIAPHEMANLFLAIVKESYSILPEELVAESLKFLGYTRKGGETVEYVESLIDWAVSEGLLTKQDGRLVLAGSSDR